MKRKSLWLSSGLLLLAAVLAVLPGPAAAEMYFEAYLGGVQGANAPMDSRISDNFSFILGDQQQVDLSFRTGRIPGRLDPAFLGGVKLGTWFVREGFLGFDYPAWMKYFGFYLDFMMHRLDFRRQSGNAIFMVNGVNIPTSFTFWSEGVAPTLAFMFAARYGFFPDSEVPFGRLQPYVAVGPAIMFASQQPAFSFSSGLDTSGIDLESRSSTVICLAVEAGLRWMALKNVSIDVSFKYRYAQPSFTYTGFSPITMTPTSITLDPTFHLFSGQIGAAYHF